MRRGQAIALATLLACGVAYAAGTLGTLGVQPVIERATQGRQCVAAPATMRREHMRMLSHQRDATVHGGIRGAQHSLRGCIGCHASAATQSVAGAPTDFCVSCHQYAAVRIDCFECHAATRAPTGAAKP